MRLNILPLLSFCLTLGPVGEAFAQNHANDYRVEVLIFERQYRNESPLDEKWPRNISLSYPEKTRYLHDPDQPGLDTPIDPDSFQTLPDSDLKLTRHRSAVEKDYRLRTLFHSAWKQPLGPTQSAPALVIRGGNAYGEHYELEGVLTFGVSRYVHVDTDLWLSEFVPNHGQEPEYWMALPSLPGTFEDGGIPTLGGLMFDDTTDEADGEPESETAVEPMPEDQVDYHSNLTNAQSDQTEGPMDRSDELVDPMEELRDAPYFIKDIVTMRQSRRMRTNELHYLDHPRIGILIQIEPLR